MRTNLTCLLLAIGLLAGIDARLDTARAQGTAFTYSGSFDDGATPANGSYNLTFTLCGTATGGIAYETITNAAVPVTNGYFSVILDFGPVFNGSNYWIELAECTNGVWGFNTLVPREPVTPAPEAIYSTSSGTAAMANWAASAGTAASASSVAAANLTGTVNLSQLPGTLLTNNQAGVILGGTFNGGFNGNGLGLTNIPALGLNGIVPLANLPGAVLANLSTPVLRTLTVTNTTGFNFYIADGTWAQEPVPYIEPVAPNQCGVLDVMSSSATTPAWIDIGTPYNLSQAGQYLSLGNVPGQYADIMAKGLGSGPVVPLVIQGPASSPNGGAVESNVGFFNLPDDAVSVQLKSNLAQGLDVINNAGSSGYARIAVKNLSGVTNDGLELDSFYTNFLSNGAFQSNSAAIQTFKTNGLAIITRQTTAPIQFYVGGYNATNNTVSFTTTAAIFNVPVSVPAVSALNFAGNGAGLTNIPASGLSGTITDSQLSANIARLNQASTFNNPGNVFAGTFTGNGAGLTNLPAGTFTGAVADTQLSANVPRLNQANNFNNPGNDFVGAFTGNGAGLTNLPAGDLSGTLADSELSTNIPELDQANTFDNPSNSFVGAFTGNGAGLTNLPPGILSGMSGILTDTQLSANIAKLNQANTFNNPGNKFVGTFSGNGSGLTNLPPGVLSGMSGILTDTQLSQNIPRLNQANNFGNPGNAFAGSFTGNGAGLTSLAAASLTGSVPLVNLGNAITNWTGSLIVTNPGTGNNIVITNGQVMINGFPALTNCLHSTGTPTVSTNVAGEYSRIISSIGDQTMTVVTWFTNSPSSKPGTPIFTINFAHPYSNPPCLGYTSGLSSDGTFDGGMRPTLFVWGIGTTNATMYVSSAATGMVPSIGKYYTNYLTFAGQ